MGSARSPIFHPKPALRIEEEQNAPCSSRSPILLSLATRTHALPSPDFDPRFLRPVDAFPAQLLAHPLSHDSPCSPSTLTRAPRLPDSAACCSPSTELQHPSLIKHAADDLLPRRQVADDLLPLRPPSTVAFHLLESSPAAVIIDDFGDFFTKGKYQDKYGPRGRDVAVVYTLASCQHAISHANSKLQPGGSCKLLLSDTQKRDNTSLLFIYKIWIQSIFTIEGGGTGSFFLKKMANQSYRPTRMRIAKYSIACLYLTLEEMLEE